MLLPAKIVLCVLFIGFVVASATPTCRKGRCVDGGRRCRDFVCCRGAQGGEWVPNPRMKGEKCCPGSGRTYPLANHVCDSGEIRPKSHRNETMCGYTVPYNPTTQVCCKSNLSFAKVYERVPHGQCCNHNYLTDGTKCCGGQSYNVAEHTCCNSSETVTGVRLFDMAHGECCNDQPFDPAISNCTDELVVVDRDSISRCNGQAYNPDVFGCCALELYLKSEFLCHDLTGNLVPKSNPNLDTLCRSSSGELMAYEAAHDPRVQCVDNWGFVRVGEMQAVCGTGSRHTVYNTSTDLCCGAYDSHPGALAQGKRCCKHGTNVYDPQTQVCCRDVTFDTIAEINGGSCCNRDPYNNRTHKCRNNIEVVESECPDPHKLPIEERCTVDYVTASEVSAKFKRSGMTLIIATIGDVSSTRKTLRWTLHNVTTLLTKGRKNRIVTSLKSLTSKKKGGGRSRGRVMRAEAAKCSCPHHLQEGGRYLFITSKPFKKSKLRISGIERGPVPVGGDLVVNLDDSATLLMVTRLLLG